MTSSDLLKQRVTPPWFDEAKLGIFVHWNPAAIPGFAPRRNLHEMPDDPEMRKMWRRLPYAEMYLNTLDVPGSVTSRYHKARYGDQTYDDFVATFRDEMIPQWDPNPMADLIAQSGARYSVMYTKMEDGFIPWPTNHPNPFKERWNSERDVVGELAAAVRARGLRFGVGFSGGMDWTFPGELPLRKFDNVNNTMAYGEQYREYTVAHLKEMIDRYKPEVLWNDWSLPPDTDLVDLFTYYFGNVPEGVVNNRFDPPPFRDMTTHTGDVYADFLTPEFTLEGTPEHKWEACRGIGTSFGYNRFEGPDDYIDPKALIHMFVDIVARGGNLLLNIAPTPTGQVPWEQASRVLALGWWMRQYGSAIYGTRPWEKANGITGDAIDVRYTCDDEAVHAIVLGTPMDLGTADAYLEVDVRLDKGATVELENRPGELQWESTPAGTRVKLPEIPDPSPAMAIRMSPPEKVHNFTEE